MDFFLRAIAVVVTIVASVDVVFSEDIDALFRKDFIHAVHLVGIQFVFFHDIHDFCIRQAAFFLARLDQLLNVLERYFLAFLFTQLIFHLFRLARAGCFLGLLFCYLVFVFRSCHVLQAPFLDDQAQRFISFCIFLHIASVSTSLGSFCWPYAAARALYSLYCCCSSAKRKRLT